MEDETYYAVPPASEVPDGATPLGDHTTNYVGDVDETPPAEDNPYQSFGEEAPDDNPYQSFGDAAPMGDDFGFASGDAPIILGPPADEDMGVFGEQPDAGVEDGEDEDEPMVPVSNEPTPMQKWNEEFQELLHQRREAENAKRGDQVEAARHAMEEFHAARDARREARLSKNRQEEQAKLEAIEADLENDNSWQRVCKMVELTHDSTKEAADIKRMRDVLILLKNDTARAQLLS
jgi:hypothetical protein